MVRIIFILLVSMVAGWGMPMPMRAQVNIDAVMLIGRNALYYEDYALSIQYFNQAISAKPYLYAPYYYRAIAKYYLGDHEGAVNDCNLSIERDPYITEVYRLRAINNIRTDNYEEASRDYYTLINDRAVKDRDIWYNLVLCQTQLNQHSEADRLLDSMIVTWPDYARCYMLKAQIAVISGDTIKADSLLCYSLKIDSTDVDAMSALALLSLQRQQYSRADSIYTKILAHNPRNSSFYINRALARYQQTDLRGAMDDYNAAIETNPDNYLAHYNRALLRMHVGENNLAIEDFDFVLTRHPEDRLALYNRAILAQQTGDYRRAIKDYTAIVNEFPDFVGVYVNRSYCYNKIGDKRRSDADERKIMQLQLNHAYTHKEFTNPLDTITRSKSDSDIEDYDKLMTDDPENLAPFYASEYRGRIQNKQTTIDFQPLYGFTFFRTDNGLSNSVVRSTTLVDQINNIDKLYASLSLSARETPMTDAQCLDIRDCCESIEKKLAVEYDVNLLLIHALYLAVARDYESAIQNLNQCIDHNATNAALFLRSYSKARLAEVQTTKLEHSSDVIKSHYISAINDLSVAIKKDIDNGVLYYNRGTLYARSMEYAKAIADFDKALQLEPDLPEIYYNRGLSFIYRGELQQGLNDLSKAGELGLFTAYGLIKHFRK